MELPIIVLIDTEARAVRLFGKITRTIPFQIAFILPSLLSGQEVLYITGIQAVSGEDVINQLTYLITDQDQPTEKLYIRSKKEDYVRVSELKMVFSGPKDAKLIENYGWDLFERSPTLRKLLLEDKVEILLESEAKALKKNRPDPKSKDKALDTILLTKSVNDIINNKDMFGPDGGDGELVSEDDANEKVYTENEKILRQYHFGKDRNA